MAQAKVPPRSLLDSVIGDYDLSEIKRRATLLFVDRAPNWGGSSAKTDDFRFELIVRSTFDYLYCVGLIDQKNLEYKIYNNKKPNRGEGGSEGGAAL